MKGYMVVFFTQQNHRYKGKMLGEWIVDVAKEMGLRGTTLCTGIEGFGHTGKLHSLHFFELADQPTEIRLAITEDEAERLFERLDSEEISVFFTKTPIEMGTLGKTPSRAAPSTTSEL
jgi:PII-like signaling protein